MRPQRTDPLRLLTLTAALLAGLLATGAFSTEPDSFDIVKKLFADGARETALGQARLYLEKYPQGDHRDLVTAWLGGLLAERGDAEAALALLTAPLQKLQPKERAKVNLALGRVYLDLRQPEKAKGLLAAPGPLEKADLPKLRQLLGRAAYDLGQFEEAAKILRGLSLAERTTEDALRLTRALVNCGDDKGGRAEAQSLLSRGGLKPPDEASVRLLQAGCLYRLGDFAAVAPVAAPLVSQGEWRTEAMLLQAWALHRLGQEAEAYDLARKAVPLAGWEEGALLAPLRAARLRLDFPALEGLAQRFMELYPKSVWAFEARLALAKCAEEVGDSPRALRELESALPDMSEGEGRFRAALAAGRLAAEALRDWPRAKRHFGHAVEVAPGKASRAEALLAMARSGRSLGATTEALSALTRLVKEFPDTPAIPGAYLLLGELRCAEGEYPQGREAFKVVVESFLDTPEYPEAVLALAESLRPSDLETGQARRTLRALDGLPLTPRLAASRDRLLAELSLESGDAEAAEDALFGLTSSAFVGETTEKDRFLLGCVRIGRGDIEAASEQFAALTEPELAAAGRLRLAERTFGAKPEEAAALFESLLSSGSDAATTSLFLLAQFQAVGGDREGASATLARLAASGGDDPVVAFAQRKIEMTLLANEGPAAALAAIPAFREAEPVSPALVADLLKTARLANKSGAPEKADRAYRSYLELAPRGPGAAEASIGLARSAARKGDWGGGRTILSRAPESAARDALLGAACYALRDMPAAQAAYERALAVAGPEALSPQETLEAHYFAGMAAAIQGNRESTAAHWSVYAREAPATPAGRERLFQVTLWLQRQQKLEPALAGLDRLRASWRDAAVGFQYAYTLELIGKSEEALTAFLTVARTSSNAQWSVTARYRAAELMVQLNRKDDAIALYRDLAAATEGSVQGDFAKERLRALEATDPPPPSQETPDAPAAPPH